MASDLMFTVGADATEFSNGLARASADGVRFAGDITKRVGEKFIGMRDLANTVATALGLNMEEIAKKIARFMTGVSEEEEGAYKKSEQLSTQAADLAIKNMRDRLSDEQKYQLALRERDRLMDQLSSMEIRSGADMERAAQKRIELETKIGEIQAYEAKQREAADKAFDDAVAARVKAGDDEFKAAIDVLATSEKIAALKSTIAYQQAIIASGALDEKNAQAMSAQLAERKTMLAQEEAKQRQEVAKQQEDFLKRSALSFDQELQFFALTHKNRSALSDDEQQLLDLLTKQKQEKTIHVQIEDLEAKVITGKITPAEEQRLTALIKQDDALKQQISVMTAAVPVLDEHVAKQQQITAEIQKQLDMMNHVNDVNHLAENAPNTTFMFDGMTIGPARPDEYFYNLPDDVLRKIVRENQAKIAQLESTKYSSASTGAEMASGFLHRSEAEGQLQTEINRANAVIMQNSALRGLDRSTALARYNGDPASFEAAYNRANSETVDQLTKLNQSIDDIAYGLNSTGIIKGRR